MEEWVIEGEEEHTLTKTTTKLIIHQYFLFAFILYFRLVFGIRLVAESFVADISFITLFT
jgi:hypothetical protein